MRPTKSPSERHKQFATSLSFKNEMSADTPTPLRSVIEGIRTGKSTFDAKSDSTSDSPYRPLSSWDVAASTSTSATSTTTQNSNAASSTPSAAAPPPPSTPPRPSSSSSSSTSASSSSSSSSSGARVRKSRRDVGGLLALFHRLRATYTRIYLANIDMFAQVENVAASALFLMPGSMRDSAAEIGSLFRRVERERSHRACVCVCVCTRSLSIRWHSTHCAVERSHFVALRQGAAAVGAARIGAQPLDGRLVFVCASVSRERRSHSRTMVRC